MNGSIQGTVANQDGSLYEGVQVTLSINSKSQTATTDTDGHFLFSDVAPGPFQLTFSGTGFATQLISATLHPGESYQAQPVVLRVSTMTSEIRVTESPIEVAQQELQDEEQQHVLGIFPNFYVVYDPKAPPLTAKQKFHLAWRSSIDPVGFIPIAAVAGIQQATNSFSGYGQGAQGYAKRFGAIAADNFVGNMLGGAIFPSLFRQDPRYLVKGSGTRTRRTLYALANAVMCRGDNGHWQVNYSGILGSLAASGVSNLYYPASDRNGVSLTFENAAIGIGGSAAANILQEFVIRKFTPKTHPKSANPDH